MDKPVLDPRYPIETERLLLRPFAMHDLDALHLLQSLPEVVRYLLWEPRTGAEVVRMLEERTRQTRLVNEGDKINPAVTLRDDGALIGDVNLKWLSIEHRRGEIGFVFLPEHQCQGYGHEATCAMLALGFDGLA